MELLRRQRDGLAQVERVAQDRRGRLERAQRQPQDAAHGGGIDRDARRAEAAGQQHLHDRAAVGVPHDDRRPVEGADGSVVVIDDLREAQVRLPVDRVIEEAEVSRATFYRHFPGKEELVRAYLEREDERIRARFAEAARSAESPAQLPALVAAALGDEICGAGFRGCPFINAAAEYPDRGHPIHQAVDTHRTWFRQTLTDTLTAAGHPDPAHAAQVLILLRDGAMVGGYLDDPEQIRTTLEKTIARL
ncbi:hypothetical protein GCM10017786_25560 [Amycolatopsis deserti]|uniref:HTH tetR-type domain-containing protein n=1 Tax=Amycolatopsis deserti TaxID=185696 RepID=A0ABQ3IQU8_9PSEU|nr:hypothetical protein GCM10017786_25560 [Amycolatopsis deserti]